MFYFLKFLFKIDNSINNVCIFSENRVCLYLTCLLKFPDFQVLIACNKDKTIFPGINVKGLYLLLYSIALRTLSLSSLISASSLYLVICYLTSQFQFLH